MRNRLAAGLKGFFDVDNPQLLAFGVPPRQPKGQRRRRLTKGEKAAQAAASAAERSEDPAAVN